MWLTDLQTWIDDHPSQYRLLSNALRPTHPVSVTDVPFVTWESLLKAVGSSALAGGGVDGLIAAIRAWRAYDEGQISKQTFAAYVASETGCGATSSGAGAAAAKLVREWTGDSGIVTVLSGLGASLVVRQFYRRLGIGPDIEDDIKVDQEFDADSLEEQLEAIEEAGDDEERRQP